MHKKLISVLLLMALITLPACSQNPAPAATLSPRPTATASPTPIFTPSPTSTPPTIPITYEPVAALPDYYPPLDFAVDSVWKAEPFGDRGGALIYMSKISDGIYRFRVYMYQYIFKDSYLESMTVESFAADGSFDGETYRFSLEKVPYTSYTDESGQFHQEKRPLFSAARDIAGSLNLNGNSLSLIFTDIDFDTAYSDSTRFCLFDDPPGIVYTAEWSDAGSYTLYFPKNFEKAGEPEAGQLMYSIPMQYDEVIVTEQVKQYVNRYATYATSDPDQLPSARGVKIGDSLMSVLSRFMLEPEGLKHLQEQEQGEFSVLYGGQGRSFNAYAVLSYEEGNPSALTYYAGAWITFNFDENLCVREVRYSIDW